MGWINTAETPAEVDQKLVEILDRMYERDTTTVREWIRWNQE